ncbi:hypothetical protein [Lactococcus formosensis]|uniref:Uncharacterized protein n=1 Tax=Lactococcus formosensis TaxID=1281486 RepID=A0A9Q8Y038_9LACT|nr:hypothetical protein [Lactococcus formosensis]USJ19548.1 hypothetical protein LMK00_06845 [Lactococcus formosensis]
MKVKTEEAIKKFNEELTQFLSTDMINSKEDEFTFIKQFGDGQAIIAKMVAEDGERTLKYEIIDSLFFAEKTEDTLDIFGGEDD